MKNSGQSNLTRRREPLTDTQLLLTITICIFVRMYVLAMIIWGGGISVGGVVALVAMVGVMILNGNLSFFNNLIASLGLAESWRIVFAALMALLIGLAFGLVQGFLIANLEIQPFIITLAGMFFARGMITIVSVDPQKAPQNLMDILQTRIDIPWLGSVNRRQLGRSFYAVGGKQQSALMLGVNVRKTRFMAHLICGVLSGIAGFVFMMHTGAGNATNATAAEMNAIASSIIGGTLLTGGVGNVIGTFFGVLTLSTIKSIVTTSGLRDPWWQSITTGAMLSFFILLQSVVLMRKNRARAAGKKKEEKEEK